ncbi:MAG TPA: hypothetical protein VEQ11_11035, partial [Chloroflexota bacterium]|nr:hypothetical protein [Chloroflexota bacterium]
MRNGADDFSLGLTRRLTRRQLLRVGGVAGFGLALLSACAPQAAAPPAPKAEAPQPAAQPTAAQAAPAAA